jgi:hypothetical protein
MRLLFFFFNTARPNTLLAGVCFSACLLSSCATTAKTDAVLDRSATPGVSAEVPAEVSEIRELKFHKLPTVGKPATLRLEGQLFTKSSENGSIQIRPCGNCTVQLDTPSDTSTHVRITTESDGYFVFNGRNQPYTLSLANPGYNPLYLGAVSFEDQGVTTIRLINAAGNKQERFSIVKTGREYSWMKTL